MQLFNFERYATKREIDILSKTITAELDDLKNDVDILTRNQSGLMGGINSIKWIMTALLIPIAIMLVRDIFVDQNADVKQNDDDIQTEIQVLKELLEQQQRLQYNYRLPPPQ